MLNSLMSRFDAKFRARYYFSKAWRPCIDNTLAHYSLNEEPLNWRVTLETFAVYKGWVNGGGGHSRQTEVLVVRLL